MHSFPQTLYTVKHYVLILQQGHVYTKAPPVWVKGTESVQKGKGNLYLYSAVSNSQDYFTLYSLVNRTPLGFSGKHSVTFQLMREHYSYTNIHRCLYPDSHSYSWENWSNIDWINCPVFDITAQDLNQGLKDRSSSNCATARQLCVISMRDKLTPTLVLLLTSVLRLIIIHVQLINKRSL